MSAYIDVAKRSEISHVQFDHLKALKITLIDHLLLLSVFFLKYGHE